MILPLLFAVLVAPDARYRRVLPAPSAQLVIGGTDLFTLHVDNSTSLIDLDLIDLRRSLRTGMLVYQVDDGPTVLELSYEDVNGLHHRVTTDCRNMTVARCVARHKEFVDATLELWPQRRR